MTDALAQFNAAVEVQRLALPDSLDALIYTLQTMGSSWLAQGRYGQAETCLREAWELSRQLPADHPEKAESATYLASALFMQGKLERAVPLLKLALSIYERAPNACQLGPVLTTLARVDASEQHYAMAEQKLQRVLSIFDQCYSPSHIAVGFAQANLAQLYIDQRKYEQAQPLVESASIIIRAGYPETHPSVAAILYEKARLEAGLLDCEQADTHFRESIRRYKNSTDPRDPRLGMMLRTYAAFLRKEHRNSEAKPLEAQAKSIFALENH
jgi:tetratricopeptide (TPR) repeat protein